MTTLAYFRENEEGDVRGQRNWANPVSATDVSVLLFFVVSSCSYFVS